jgi:hypothetical protein
MKRLNRWQRTGIVLSVVWAIVGGTWGWRHAGDQITEDFKACVRAIETRSDLQAWFVEPTAQPSSDLHRSLLLG